MIPTSDHLAAALAERYRLERELGRGGMATVYLAHDLRHDRPVALKVLHPDLAGALGPERFEREIRLAARLQHPHILTVHDSGESAGQLWFTMPFVEGESLRNRLEREKQLPVDDALRIAREAADALDYAHRHGVIHRDIKPENVLLAEGHALVADFGIARALTPEAGTPQLTETGMSLGTAAYMSPEQAAGERDLDARSDVYSLAIVLYEMLAGETPFVAATPQATIARRFTETPKPLRAIRESVPEHVERAVQAALARTAADRFSSARAFAEALGPAVTTGLPANPPGGSTVHGASGAPSVPAAPVAPATSRSRRRVPLALATMVLGFIVGLGVLFAWRERQGGAGETAGGPRRIAVLPFQNVGDSANAYFADGITDAVRGKLTALAGLQVTASNSSNEYANTTKSPREIAQELGVAYLLTGKVRWAKGADGTSRVQVSPELIEAATAAATWQQSFDAPLTDVFQVQADIASRVASALDVALGAGEAEQLAERPTRNLAAYDAYLRGEEMSGGMSATDPATLARAATYYEQATALDPGFALAWARLSHANSLMYLNGAPTSARAEAARRAAERARELAPDGVAGYRALGGYSSLVLGDSHQAAAAFSAGLRLAPGNAELISGLGAAEMSMGRWDSSLVHLQRAAALDPRSTTAADHLGRVLLCLRRYPEAQAAFDRALALNPTGLLTREGRLMVDLARGDLDAARAALRATPREVDAARLVAFLGNYYDLYWVLDDAQQRLLLRLSPAPFDNNRATWGIVLAETYWVRGDTVHARAYADSARIAYKGQLRASPEDPQLHSIDGLALAYSGHPIEAIREGERGVALLPITEDAYFGAYLQHQLVRIYLLAGQPEKALDLLEPLLEMPSYLSPGWLRIDPNFAPLRGNPRFERLINGGS